MINYANLLQAMEMYRQYGYRYIEVPWTVPNAIALRTAPDWVIDPLIKLENGKSLIASGEQGFLQLLSEGSLPIGDYQTITPCFRDDIIDDMHCKQFMKLELISVVNLEINDESVNAAILRIVNNAKQVFNKIGIKHEMQTTSIISSDIEDYQIDIEAVLNNGKETIELGSYGVRETAYAKWIYGTGLAEPRFTRVLNKLK